MQDKPTSTDNQNVPEKPKMVKPVSGQFKQNQKKLRNMVKNAPRNKSEGIK